GTTDFTPTPGVHGSFFWVATALGRFSVTLRLLRPPRVVEAIDDHSLPFAVHALTLDSFRSGRARIATRAAADKHRQGRAQGEPVLGAQPTRTIADPSRWRFDHPRSGCDCPAPRGPSAG